MKIIGKTDRGFIVEADADELAQAAGYRSAWSWAHGLNVKQEQILTIGTVIQTTVAVQWLEKLREKEKGVRGAAAFMRQLADHVEAGLPSTIVPPETEEAT